MKKILIFLLFPLVASGQFYVAEGDIYLKKTMTAKVNQQIIAYLDSNFQNIISWEGKTSVYIPYEKILLAGYNILPYDNQQDVGQYEVTEISSNLKVNIIDNFTRFKKYDFKKKMVSDHVFSNDDSSYIKPKDYQNKCKEKEKKNLNRKWKRENKKIRKHILSDGSINLRTINGTVTIYRNGILWFIITQKWKTYKILKNELKLFFTKIKWYILDGRVKYK